jgi:hypothetical protein
LATIHYSLSYTFTGHEFFFVFEFKEKKASLLIHKIEHEKRMFLKELYCVKHTLPSNCIFGSGTDCMVYKTFLIPFYCWGVPYNYFPSKKLLLAALTFFDHIILLFTDRAKSTCIWFDSPFPMSLHHYIQQAIKIRKQKNKAVF